MCALFCVRICHIHSLKSDIWRFPKIGVPVIIHLNRIFLYKHLFLPSSGFWATPMAMKTAESQEVDGNHLSAINQAVEGVPREGNCHGEKMPILFDREISVDGRLIRIEAVQWHEKKKLRWELKSLRFQNVWLKWPLLSNGTGHPPWHEIGNESAMQNKAIKVNRNDLRCCKSRRNQCLALWSLCHPVNIVNIENMGQPMTRPLKVWAPQVPNEVKENKKQRPERSTSSGWKDTSPCYALLKPDLARF